MTIDGQPTEDILKTEFMIKKMKFTIMKLMILKFMIIFEIWK